ncbi:glycosyltransferase [Methylomonas sp. LWB]|uniref:MJ1255/VC2487 family glycosyltransferase n=1 Tax=Methylomonas sp. LWB TaxID=1905845 RepID=UPI0008D9073D|nr:MJ1255/VC2487 family glycosyltransferase [Methylomonas sp. LWB]OHX37544.1 glycosyltransferase [Methylomonas sp. LWB]
MKIFYGVQGTGNGHITRARVMARELNTAGFDVTFQFSGRPADKYFDMEVFNGYQLKDGLTFNTHKGQVSYVKTALQAKPIRFVKDIGSLDLSGYDLIISDFEPVTAWAAKRQRKPVLGIGHQYAFGHDIPRAGGDPIAERVMKYFAPADIGVGLHWHHFGQPILPPIIETPAFPQSVQANKILVYLPFEDIGEVMTLLSPFENYQFHVYAPEPIASPYSHIQCKPLSRQGFQTDLYDSAGIISNAGFELASESLQLGKKILVKPLHAQMEQISNAAALKQLGYGHTMYNLDAAVIDEWLRHPHAVHVTYPNVAKVIVDWLKDGMPAMDADFTERVWEKVDVLQVSY